MKFVARACLRVAALTASRFCERCPSMGPRINVTTCAYKVVQGRFARARRGTDLAPPTNSRCELHTGFRARRRMARQRECAGMTAAAAAVAISAAADEEDEEEDDDKEEKYLVDLLPGPHIAARLDMARAAVAAEDRLKTIGVAAACHSSLTPHSVPTTPTTHLPALGAQQSFPSWTSSDADNNDFPNRDVSAPVDQRAPPIASAPSGGVVRGVQRSGIGGRGSGGDGGGGCGGSVGGGGGVGSGVGGGGDGGRGQRGGDVGGPGPGAGDGAAAAAAAADSVPIPTRLVSRVVRRAASVRATVTHPATCCGAATCFCETCDPDFAALAEYGLARVTRYPISTSIIL